MPSLTMDFNNLTLFAAFGSLVAFWQQIKGFISRIFSFFIRGDVIADSGQAINFLREILPDTKLFYWGNNTYLCENLNFPAQKVWANVIFSYFKSYPAIYKRRPIILSESGQCGLKVTYLAGTFPMAKILEKVNQKEWSKTLENSHEKHNNFYIIEVSGSDEAIVPPSSGRNSKTSSLEASAPQAPDGGGSRGIFGNSYTLAQYGKYFGQHYSATQNIYCEENNESYFWSAEAKKLDREISFWMENRKWYCDRNLSWRRGALLYGKPGSGKTKLVLKCAEKHGIPVRKLNISNMSNSEFTKAFEVENSDGQIILLEDLDATFKMRTNVLAESTHTKQLLSFDTLINIIGGIKAANGSFVIITTNHIENLDPALTRAGRIDAKIEIGPLCEDGRRFVAQNILRDWPNLVDKSVKECENMVAAEFENYCIELAIQEKNKEND